MLKKIVNLLLNSEYTHSTVILLINLISYFSFIAFLFKIINFCSGAGYDLLLYSWLPLKLFVLYYFVTREQIEDKVVEIPLTMTLIKKKVFFNNYIFQFIQSSLVYIQNKMKIEDCVYLFNLILMEVFFFWLTMIVFYISFYIAVRGFKAIRDRDDFEAFIMGFIIAYDFIIATPFHFLILLKIDHDYFSSKNNKYLKIVMAYGADFSNPDNYTTAKDMEEIFKDIICFFIFIIAYIIYLIREDLGIIIFICVVYIVYWITSYK